MTTFNPGILRVKDGRLIMADGSDPAEYLSARMAKVGVDEHTPVVIMTLAQYERIKRDLYVYRNMGA